MMGKFTRYVIAEILKLFLVALVATTTLIMLAGVIEKLISEGLGPLAILQLLPYVLPVALQFAVPPTLLFAVCSVYGRMAADNEIVAVKSAGVSPMRVITPTLVLAFLISPLAVWMNDLAVSWGRPGINRVVMHSVEEIVYGVLRKHRSYSTAQGFQIHVQDVEDRWLIVPTITLHSDSGHPLTITASKGQLRLDPESEKLRIQLVDAQWDMGGEVMGSLPGISEEEIPLDRATRKGEAKGNPSQFALRSIVNEVRLQEREIDTNHEQLAAHIGMNLMSGRFDQLEDDETRRLQGAVDEGAKRLYRLQTEPWRRWGIGFSCFFFVWVGIPMAIWMRSADYWTSFGACFLPILLMYYPLFALGLDRAKNGVWPPYAVWLGNLVLLAVGGWMLRKIYRS